MRTRGFLLLVALTSLCATSCSQLPPPSRSFAPAEGGWNHRLAPDGRQLAWLEAEGAKAWAHEPHALVLHLTDGDGEHSRAVMLAEDDVGGDWWTHGPAWSTDARHVYVVQLMPLSSYESKPRLLRVDLLDGSVHELARFEHAIYSLDIDPTGQRLALMSGARLLLCDSNGTTLRTIEFPQKASFGSTAAFSPDGSRLAVVTARGLWFIDATDTTDTSADRPLPEPVCAVPQDSVWMAQPLWRTDGDSVVVAAGGGVIEASVTRGELFTWTERDLGGRSEAVVFLPDQEDPAVLFKVEKKGGPLSAMLGAGHERSTWSVRIATLAHRDGNVAVVPDVTFALSEPARNRLPYLPGLTELLARR